MFLKIQVLFCILVGFLITPSIAISVTCDLDGDQKVGLGEAIHILRFLSGDDGAICNFSENCSEEQFCFKNDSACGETGVCAGKPATCDMIWDPVCGCDGNTYGNRCEVAAAGVNVQYVGECQGYCTGTDECDSSSFCLKDEANCKEGGRCKQRPRTCTDSNEPVCGCDGETYKNVCWAAMSGTSVDYNGECLRLCLTDRDCGSKSVCIRKDGECSSEGVCKELESICRESNTEVIGCDFRCYSNRCEAARAGVSILREAIFGECSITCQSDEQCPPNNYCEKGNDGCSGIGKCEIIETGFCISLYDPVCGCDGNTYGNSCEASVAGVSIAYEGFCLSDIN